MSATHHLANCIATFFYVGKSPKAPGTMGSLAALPFAWFLWNLTPPLGWAIFFLVFLLGTVAAELVIRRTGTQDNQIIVIDEVLGIFLITSVAAHALGAYILAFVLFRAFDISKPWPVSWVDRNIKGGLGTILDDLVAALMATVLFLLLRWAMALAGINL